TAQVLGFPDVPDSYPYREAIGYLHTTGVIHGYPDNTFHPDEPVKRGEMVKMVMGNAPAACAQQSAQLFTDTDPAAWYYPYLCMAKRRNIISGYTDGTFRPADNV